MNLMKMIQAQKVKKPHKTCNSQSDTERQQTTTTTAKMTRKQNKINIRQTTRNTKLPIQIQVNHSNQANQQILIVTKITKLQSQDDKNVSGVLIVKSCHATRFDRKPSRCTNVGDKFRFTS